VDRSSSHGDGATVQPGEKVEPDWKDQGQDQGKADREEQEGDIVHGVRCNLKGSIRAIRYVKLS